MSSLNTTLAVLLLFLMSTMIFVQVKKFSVILLPLTNADRSFDISLGSNPSNLTIYKFSHDVNIILRANT